MNDTTGTLAFDLSYLPENDPSDTLYFKNLGPLFADKYAYAMASALFEAERKGAVSGLFASPTIFQMFVRQLPKTGMVDANGNPSRSSYLMTAGDLPLAEWLSGWRYTRKDLQTLAEEVTPKGTRLYSNEFLQALSRTNLNDITIKTIRDGDLAFEREPLVQVEAPFYIAEILEAGILQIKNSCIDFATLASQAVTAAQGRPVYEYGLRRAQDIGGIGPSYATFVGGFAGTSNCLARKHIGIPATGTMAHALVMLGGDELEAFGTWVQGAPDVAVFLVDTFDTLDGVRNAIKTCQKYGVKLNGIRLDSGDLGYFAKEARKLMDAAGFDEAKIFASNDLDPAKINQLLVDGAPIDMFACGTWAATASANPALGGVYKLARAWNEQNIPRDVMKFSEERIKATLPGALDVLRIIGDDGQFAGDVIVPLDSQMGIDTTTREIVSVDPLDNIRRKSFRRRSRVIRPLQTFWQNGHVQYDYMDVRAAQARGRESLSRLDPEHRRLLNPHRYVAGVEQSLNKTFTRALERNRQRHITPAARALSL